MEDQGGKSRRTIAEDGILSLCGNRTIVPGRERKLLSKCSSPIKDKKDEVIGYVIVFRDITEQRKQEEQLALSPKKWSP